MFNITHKIINTNCVDVEIIFSHNDEYIHRFELVLDPISGRMLLDGFMKYQQKIEPEFVGNIWRDYFVFKNNKLLIDQSITLSGNVLDEFITKFLEVLQISVSSIIKIDDNYNVCINDDLNIIFHNDLDEKYIMSDISISDLHVIYNNWESETLTYTIPKHSLTKIADHILITQSKLGVSKYYELSPNLSNKLYGVIKQIITEYDR